MSVWFVLIYNSLVMGGLVLTTRHIEYVFDHPVYLGLMTIALAVDTFLFKKVFSKKPTSKPETTTPDSQ
jgi:hypothetical protein